MLGYPKVFEDTGGVKQILELKNSRAEFIKISDNGNTAYYNIECPVCHENNIFSFNISELRKARKDVHPTTVDEYDNGYLFRSEFCSNCGVKYLPRLK